MTLTQRQEKLLEKIIKEYIHSAAPVSSKLLFEKYNFEVSPATLRNEMQKLTKQGYLYQPHISAGRIPSDEGYRFFVNNLFEKGCFRIKEERKCKILEEIKEEVDNSITLIQVISKILAQSSSNLGLSFLSKQEILWKEGWERVFSEPEFQEGETAFRFIKTLNSFERNIKKFVSEISLEPKVYIGKENPIPRSDDFSIITARFICPGYRCEGIFAILGPKRMNYNRNISLISFLTQLLQKK